LKKQFIKFINPALFLVLKRENHSAELQRMYYLCRRGWIRKPFTVVVCSNQVSPCFLKLFKPPEGVEFQAAPATPQKKDQLTCCR
jgi:hypothetical protein